MNNTEFVTHLIQHAETFPDVDEIALVDAEKIVSMLDRSEALPDITPEELMTCWNTLIHDPAVMDID